MPAPKQTRTKEQTIRLLERALQQEEYLLEKIRLLEIELNACRKEMENPHHELDMQALNSSKFSFRLDYYLTGKNGPLKGIIEHLPSRKNQVFEGAGSTDIERFVAIFIHPGRKPERKQRPAKITQAAPATGFKPFFRLKYNNTFTEKQILPAGQAIQIEVPAETLAPFQDKGGQTCFVIKALERRNQIVLEERDTLGEGKNESKKIPQNGIVLPPGMYRLTLYMEQPNEETFQASRLICML